MALKQPKKLSSALSSRKKFCFPLRLFRTASSELYGLVSVIDPHFFGDLASFKARYSRQNIDDAELALLRVRLNKICNRTLRRQVQQEGGGISFTRRHSITEDFRPTEDEEALIKTGFLLFTARRPAGNQKRCSTSGISYLVKFWPHRPRRFRERWRQ